MPVRRNNNMIFEKQIKERYEKEVNIKYSYTYMKICILLYRSDIAPKDLNFILCIQ